MPLSEKHDEIERLASAFEVEAANFHDIEFSIFYVNQDGPSTYRKFRSSNHAIMLWQYYGSLGRDDLVEEFAKNLNDSDLKFGIRGAQLTQCGLIEGDACKLFIRMASRAGSLFDEDEARLFKTRVVSEIREQEKETAGKLTVVANDHPAAIWLNYLLYHLSLTNPGRERAGKIEPDPFSLSLLALERLVSDKTIGKSDRSSKNVAELAFRVALSFPGEKRRFVSRVVDALRTKMSNDAVFYDFDYQAQLARPNVDVLLQNIYHKQSELIVVFLCAEYSEKQWCGLEWRAIREIIKSQNDDKIMFVRFDNAQIDGSFSIDGYIDASKLTAKQVADLILERIAVAENDR